MKKHTGNPKPASDSTPANIPGAAVRKSRLAAALKRNLARRKAASVRSSGKEG